jgi:hypothetical protein
LGKLGPIFGISRRFQAPQRLRKGDATCRLRQRFQPGCGNLGCSSVALAGHLRVQLSCQPSRLARFGWTQQRKALSGNEFKSEPCVGGRCSKLELPPERLVAGLVKVWPSVDRGAARPPFPARCEEVGLPPRTWQDYSPAWQMIRSRHCCRRRGPHAALPSVGYKNAPPNG